MRCKMTLQKKGEIAGWSNTGNMAELVFQAVSDGTPEDRAFWAATPSGQLTLAVVNLAAVKELEVGKKYYVDVTPA